MKGCGFRATTEAAHIRVSEKDAPGVKGSKAFTLIPRLARRPWYDTISLISSGKAQAGLSGARAS